MSFAELAAEAQGHSLQEFGEPIVYASRGAAAVSTTPAGAALLGVFNAAGVRVDLQTGASVQGVGPILGVRESDLPARAVARQDWVTVRGQRYGIFDVQRDGQGWAVLALHVVDRKD